MEIPATQGLDPVTVFWRDFGPGKGQVTILCYGAAWTSYWNAMGKETIKQFFATCDEDYLFRNLGLGRHLKQSKAFQTYLLRIIRAVKTAVKP
jgi:hypothetical protein